MSLSTELLIEIVKVVGAIVTTVAVPYIAFRQRQLEKNTNSVVSRLVEETRKVSEAVGVKKEQAAQKDREDHP
jgi:hypothetical protein